MVSTDLNKFLPKLTKNTTVDAKSLQTIASSIFHSKLLYNAHARIPITKEQIGKLQPFRTNNIHKLLKNTSTYKNNKTYSNDKILSDSHLLNIPSQLQYQRLLFFKRLIQHAPHTTDFSSWKHYFLTTPWKSILSSIKQQTI
jgi:hypothetical protein